MSTSTCNTLPPWISARAAMRAAGWPRDAVVKAAELGLVGTKQPPGSRVLYWRDDVLRLAAASVRPARAAAAAPTTNA